MPHHCSFNLGCWKCAFFAKFLVSSPVCVFFIYSWHDQTSCWSLNFELSQALQNELTHFFLKKLKFTQFSSMIKISYVPIHGSWIVYLCPLNVLRVAGSPVPMCYDKDYAEGMDGHQPKIELADQTWPWWFFFWTPN